MQCAETRADELGFTRIINALLSLLAGPPWALCPLYEPATSSFICSRVVRFPGSCIISPGIERLPGQIT
jgi:hypothetical protein